jgi:hypothetical protein
MTNKVRLNKNELETILKLLVEKSTNKVEIESNGGNGIGVTVIAKIDNEEHDVTDYGCW